MRPSGSPPRVMSKKTMGLAPSEGVAVDIVGVTVAVGEGGRFLLDVLFFLLSPLDQLFPGVRDGVVW